MTPKLIRDRATECDFPMIPWPIGVLVAWMLCSAFAQDTPTDPIKAGADLRDVRAQLEMDVMNIVKNADDSPHGIEQKQLALQLLGEIGDITCVPVLIEHIGDYPLPEPDPRRPDVQKNPSKEPEPTPAMLGLRGLGPIAVEPIVDALCSEKDEVRARLLSRALEGMYCRDLVVALVEYRWRKTDNVDTRCRLDGLHVKLTGKSLNQ